MWTSGYFLVCVQYSGFHFAGVRSTFGRLQHVIQKIVNIHDFVVGHWTLCDVKTNCNNKNKCFYVETSLLSHYISEKSCQITKLCNFLTFTGTQMRKRPYFTKTPSGNNNNNNNNNNNIYIYIYIYIFQISVVPTAYVRMDAKPLQSCNIE